MRIQIVSPWYPDYAAPYSGVFVQKQAHALKRHGMEVRVDVPQIFPAPAGPISPIVTEALRRLAAIDVDAAFNRVDEATFVPTPVPARSGHLGRAEAAARSLALKREFTTFDADIYHAHLGLPTGWALLSLDDRPVVTTEHQSTLANILSDPAGSDAYELAVRRSAAFICVSEALREELRRHFGDWIDDVVQVIPNIVDLSEIPLTPRISPAFRSWIYIGSLAAHKGLELLLESFALYRRKVDPDATMRLVGAGPMTRWVERFARSKDVEGSVQVLGPRPHQAIGGLLASADVMVHLSPRETFGIASLEAIGAGLPVVSLRNGGSDSTWGDFSHICGILLDRNATPSTVVEAISELRRDPSRLDPRQARALVEERFSAWAIVARLAEVYERCLA